MQSFDIMWEKTLKFLRQDLSSVYYDTWIKDLKPLLKKNNTFYFETFSKIQTQWLKEVLRDNFYSAVTRAYKETYGSVHPSDFQIEFLNSLEAAELLNKDRSLKPRPDEFDDSDPEIALNSEYTFSTFVVGDSNKFANAAAHSVAERPGYSHNPLFLYGGVGLGKTHLMHAIGNEIKKNNPGADVVYVTAEKFMNQLITMIREANTNNDMRVNFQHKYRNADVLMIDDIQFISGSDITQNEIFHTFNALHELNKQIIISSDRPPHELTQLEERLRSRFEWGGPIDINPPDFETRIAILMTKINLIKERENVSDLPVSDEVYRYIAEQQNANIRTLEGALKRVIIYAKALGADKIDLDLTKEALFNYFSSAEKKPITLDLITDTVCRRYEIKREDIFSSKRSRDISVPRQITYYLMSELIPDISVNKIAKYFGRDHTTILYGVNEIKKKTKTDDNLREEIENLIAQIKGI